ncbi:MAG: TfoX/Sxy family protein [Saprospiraceae bacterium]|nr:TfoX/Sxy family protein [Saprospiraceae bacterium]
MPDYFKSNFRSPSEDAITAERIADLLTARNHMYELKKMFGGLCFMVNDKMLIGTFKGAVMARVDPEEADELTQRPGVDYMVMGGQSMKGFLMVEPSSYESDADLAYWVEKCLKYNPKAKASKKKKSV